MALRQGILLQSWRPRRIAQAILGPDRESNWSQMCEVNLLKEIETMLWTIAVVLVLLWLLGMVSSYTLGGFLHILLVLAVAAVLIRLIQGRSPL